CQLTVLFKEMLPEWIGRSIGRQMRFLAGFGSDGSVPMGREKHWSEMLHFSRSLGTVPKHRETIGTVPKHRETIDCCFLGRYIKKTTGLPVVFLFRKYGYCA